MSVNTGVEKLAFIDAGRVLQKAKFRAKYVIGKYFSPGQVNEDEEATDMLQSHFEDVSYVNDRLCCCLKSSKLCV